MRREGSPLTGFGAVLGKELADHQSGIRMRVLEILVLLLAFAPVYSLLDKIRQLPIGEDRFLLLYLFSLTATDWIPAFYQILMIVLPVFAIGLGFDSVSSEFNRRTMSRILSQPVYRDAVLLGKFLAGVMTLAISLLVIWMVIVGAGIFFLGVPPTAEELGRSLMFMLCSLAYASVWLALSMLNSTIFRSGAASVLCSLGLWLFFWQAWPLITGPLAELFVPETQSAFVSAQSLVGFITDRADAEQLVSRISPGTLYAESSIGLLTPQVRSLQNSTAILQQLIPGMRGGAVPGAALSFADSVLLVWPHLAVMVATSILLLTIAYIIFQRQEVRA